MLPKPGLSLAKQHLGLLFPKARAAALLLQSKRAGGLWATLSGILGSPPLPSCSPSGALLCPVASELGQVPVCFSDARGGSARPSLPFQKPLAVVSWDATPVGGQWPPVVPGAQVPAGLTVMPYALVALLPRAPHCPISPSFSLAIIAGLRFSGSCVS